MKTSKWGTCAVEFNEKSGELFIYKGELDDDFCPKFSKKDVKKIVFKEKVVAPKNSSCLFMNFTELTEFVNIENLNTDNVTDMSYMFYGCESLIDLNLSNFNTDNVTDMYAMFYGCESLINLNLLNFNTDNVTDMSHMFYDCKSLKFLNLSNFNTESVTNVKSLFNNCSVLKEVENYKFTKPQQIIINLIKDSNLKTLKQLEFINN